MQTNYSCTEGGTVACECVQRHFHVNDDWVILEAVDENNQPVPFGTQSAKVLLTNLSNKICPIIRFEITDRITLHNEPCGCGNKRPWLTLEGRTDDILTFGNGIRIAPLSLYAVLKEVHEIERFQLIQQEDNDLELRLIAENKQVAFINAKQAVESFLLENGVTAAVHKTNRLRSFWQQLSVHKEKWEKCQRVLDTNLAGYFNDFYNYVCYNKIINRTH